VFEGCGCNQPKNHGTTLQAKRQRSTHQFTLTDGVTCRVKLPGIQPRNWSPGFRFQQARPVFRHRLDCKSTAFIYTGLHPPGGGNVD
jgi:hypothetical protein